MWEFFIHLMVGTGLFVLISLPAVGLDYYVRWVSAGNTSLVIVYGLRFAEYAVFLVDLVLLVVFLLRTAWRTIKKI